MTSRICCGFHPASRSPRIALNPVVPVAPITKMATAVDGTIAGNSNNTRRKDGIVDRAKFYFYEHTVAIAIAMAAVI